MFSYNNSNWFLLFLWSMQFLLKFKIWIKKIKIWFKSNLNLLDIRKWRISIIVDSDLFESYFVWSCAVVNICGVFEELGFQSRFLGVFNACFIFLRILSNIKFLPTIFFFAFIVKIWAYNARNFFLILFQFCLILFLKLSV